MKFLTVIFYIFIGFWLLGLISRLFLRWWIPKKQREFQEHFGGGANTNRARDPKKEGEVTVTQETTQNKPHVNRDIGEYVEYEEVKDASNSQDSRSKS